MRRVEESQKDKEAVEHGHAAAAPHGKHLFYLAVGALGVVYGDIGTSPLYAFRESFHEEYGIAVIPANVLGILSLIFWSLITIISIKYLIFVMRADNRRVRRQQSLASRQNHGALAVPALRPGDHWPFIAHVRP